MGASNATIMITSIATKKWMYAPAVSDTKSTDIPATAITALHTRCFHCGSMHTQAVKP